MKFKAAVLSLLLLAVASHAAVIKKTVAYKEGTTDLQGTVVYDDALPGKQPGVVLVPDWMGPSPFYITQAEGLARLGVIAFVADIYGIGNRPKTTDDAAKMSGFYKNNRPLLRARATAALQTLQKEARVDAMRLAATGYCFGGTTVLELARSGAPLSGVVSFHGGLDTPAVNDAKNIRGKVLILHGADDPYVPADQLAGFEKEMKDANVDWQVNIYSNAVHAFTNPNAGNDNSKGAAYNPKAAARAWEAMSHFLQEIF